MSLDQELVPTFLKTLWDWGILDGCFGNNKNIKMSDIDGKLSHVNCHFLAAESKGMTGVVKEGQGRTFNRMMRTGLYTYIVVWGPVNNPKKIVVCHEDGSHEWYFNANLGTFRDICKAWWIRQEREWKASGAKYVDDWDLWLKRIGMEGANDKKGSRRKSHSYRL